MTREKRIEKLRHLITCMKCEVSGKYCDDNCFTQYAAGNMGEIIENLEEITKALEQQPRKGEWLRMSDLSEQQDNRYQCSRCGNVVHHKNKINLYTFNSWCGRCGSDNGRKIEVEL